MRKKFFIISSIIITIVLLGISGLYVLTQHTSNSDNTNSNYQNTLSPSITSKVNNLPEPTIKTVQYQALTTKTQNALFDRYSFSFPITWDLTTNFDNSSEAITLTKNNSRLDILLSEFTDITPCKLDALDDDEFDLIINLNEYNYQILNNDFGQFYYYPTTDTSYLFCGPSVDPDSKLSTVTYAGYIYFETDNINDKLEVEEIIKSIKLVN